MPRTSRVLVTCAGAMPACGVINALKRQTDVPVWLMGVDQNQLSAGFSLTDKHGLVPSASAPGYIDAVLDVCRREKIEAVFPIMDEELLVFAESRERFKKAGLGLVANDPAVVRVVRDKVLTAEHCREKGLPTPRTFTADELPKAKLPPFPLVVKPRSGRGSVGFHKADDREELDFYVKRTPGAVIQEWLDGPEFTVDVLTDLSGQVLAVVPKQRLETKAGMQTKGRIVKDDDLIEFGKRVASDFGLDLRFNAQCIRSGGKLHLIEVNAKFAASLPFTVAAGVNIPLLLLKMLRGDTVKPMIGRFKDGLVMLRYWQEVFVSA